MAKWKLYFLLHVCPLICHVIGGKTAINRQRLGLAIANISGAIKRINELNFGSDIIRSINQIQLLFCRHGG
ncbi:MAG TPA: hypothetical protein VEL11_12525 [Candidatus Bathyarchaeia archaeon]|nr:hypothetical protein [Candidatus Bathyarchaeia archaeon]